MLLISVFLSNLSDYWHILHDNGIISHPRLICCSENLTDWVLIVCVNMQNIFQRLELMLSFWQHCFSTNSPDGVFICEKNGGFHMQSIKMPALLYVIGAINWKEMHSVEPALTHHDE